MDPLSGVASAIAVIQISEEVCALLKQYISSVAQAKGDIRRLREEVLTLQSIFRMVEDLRIQPESGKLEILDLLAKPGGLIQRCLEELRDLAAKLNPGDGPTAMRRVGARALKWPFAIKDVESRIMILERYKTIFNIALSAGNTTTLLNIVLELTNIGKGIEQIDQGLTRLKHDFLVLHTKASAVQVSEKRNLIVGWLATTDPSSNHEAACKKHQSGTGKWFIDGLCMDLWKKKNSMLWLYGIPGCGKTILSSTIIESMKQHYTSDPATIIAYYYFSFNDGEKQTTCNMASSLVAQICSSITDIPKDLIALYDRCSVWKRRAAMSDLRAILKILTSRVEGEATAYIKDIFIVIDALDECPQRDYERKEALDLIEEMKSWSSTKLHLLVTSREETDIKERIVDFVTEPPISIQGSQVAADIDLYINDKLETNRKLKRLPQDLKAEIKKALVEGANGMFRWVFCQLDELEKCTPQPSSIIKALRNLPRTLNATYERILVGIDHEDCQRLARICLTWLALSKQPLSLLELAEAAVLNDDFGEDFSNLQRLPDPHYIFELLGGLIICTPIEKAKLPIGETDSERNRHQNTVTLAHFSIVDYLISEEIRHSKAAIFAVDNTTAQTFISETCIRYILGFDQSASARQKMICFDDKLSWVRTRKLNFAEQGFPLLEYACMFWQIHVKLIPDISQGRVQKLIVKFLLSKSGLWSWIRIRGPKYANLARDIDEDEMHRCYEIPDVPLFHASGIGLEYCVRQLLDQKDKVDVNEKWRGAPSLHAAIFGRRNAIVQILLDAGANVDATGNNGETALIIAARYGSPTMVKHLLRAGANVNAVSRDTATPLFRSLFNYDETIVHLLLEAQADVNHRISSGCAILHKAAARSTTDLFKRILLDYDVDINAPDWRGCSALHYAVQLGKTDNARLLVEFGIDINKQTEFGQTALHQAAQDGKFIITEMLLEANADFTLRQNDGRTAFDLAAGPEAEVILQLLQVAADFSK